MRLADIGQPKEWPDYAAEFGLSKEHVPELIDLVNRWADDDREWPDVPELYAPIHAWRALGQLRAAEAIEPLLSMLSPMAEIGDDWSLEDFPKVLGEIGPLAIPHLKELLLDRGKHKYCRTAASHGLREAAQRHPETRSQVVEVLTDCLERREPGHFYVNSALVYDLVELQATESAETIERAFSADVVDEGYMGDWEMVRKKLGVPGLGLPQPASPYNSIEILRDGFRRTEGAARQEQRRKKRKQLAAKLKQHRKKRK